MPPIATNAKEEDCHDGSYHGTAATAAAVVVVGGTIVGRGGGCSSGAGRL